MDDSRAHPHETPLQRRRQTSAFDIAGDRPAGRIDVAPMADAPQLLAEDVVMEFRRKLSAGVYDAPEVLDGLALRLLRHGVIG